MIDMESAPTDDDHIAPGSSRENREDMKDGFNSSFMTPGDYLEVKIKSGIWKGFNITLRLEIMKDNGKCSICQTRISPYKFSTPHGFMSWRTCFKCMNKAERESIKILYPKVYDTKTREENR